MRFVDDIEIRRKRKTICDSLILVVTEELINKLRNRVFKEKKIKSFGISMISSMAV
jgi:hypothetical protein